MTPELLREIGRALDGPDWQTPLARRRGVNERTVRRWTAGDRAIPDTLLAELLADIDARIADLRELRKRLQRGAAPRLPRRQQNHDGSSGIA